MSNSLYIFIFAFILITTAIYYLFEVKRCFKKLDQLLTREESIKDKQVLSDLFKTLNTKTNIELAIYNSKIGRILYAISFLLASICLFILNEHIGKSVSILLVGFFLFLPDIYICSKKISNRSLFKEVPLRNWIDLTLVLSQKYAKFASYYLSSLIFAMFLLLLLDQYFKLNKGQTPDILLSGAINSTINTTLLYESKPLDVISGNKLSFSGILFTLGIGGTVVFSLVDYYNKQNEIINRNIIEVKRYYQEWFQFNKSNLDFDPNKYNEFNFAVNSLRNEFNPYLKIKNNIKIYQFTQVLIFFVYIMGTFVIIGSDLIIGIIFQVFPIVSVLFIVMIFYLFNYSYSFISYSTRKKNVSPEKNHTINEFTSNNQDDYSNVMPEKKIKK